MSEIGTAPGTRPPVVDDIYTRALESRRVVRTFVDHATVASTDGSAIALSTVARATRGHTGSGTVGGLPEEGSEIAGTLRIDAVSDDVLRIRYAEGHGVPPNATHMVVGSLAPPERCEVKRNEDSVILETNRVSVRIGLRPVEILISDPAGVPVLRIGGPERNHFWMWDSYNTGICRTTDGRPLAVESFGLRPHEAVYGFGESFIGLDKRGQTIDLNHVEATGTITPRSYKNIPFFLSTAGYGAFLNHSSRISAWVGSMSATEIQLAVEDDFLDFYVFVGAPQHVLARYTDLTGKPQMPPDWSFGLWQSKISYSSAEEATDVVEKTREAGFGLDVLHLDTHWFKEDWFCDLEFDPERFPDPAAFMADLKRKGVRTSLWQLPYIPEGSQLFADLEAVDGFVKRPDGGLYDIGLCYTRGFHGRVGCIDFTNPEALRVYQSRIRRLHDLGADVIKADFGEEAPLDGAWHDADAPHRMHNLYPLLYNRAVAEATHDATGQWIIWARSAWAGSQRYPLHWGGDSSANWENLGPQIAGGLSLGMSGFAFWSMDIGGFFGTPGPDLFIRWLQAGLFLSHARIHGTGDRELYKLEEPYRSIARRFVRLRYRLLPYLLETAEDSVERSLPMARPLVLEFPDDPTTWTLADQWMLGGALLVAPIMDPGGRRRVYLPHATWTDWWNGERVAGGRWIEVEHGLETFPLFIREGHQIALGSERLSVGEAPIEAVEWRGDATDLEHRYPGGS